MLDVILDCFGALVLLGQAVWFLVTGRVDPLPFTFARDRQAQDDATKAAGMRQGDQTYV